MGLTYPTYLEAKTIYGCRKCKTHLSTGEAVLSRQFQGQHGQAYLFLYVVNVVQGEAEERAMTTGLHTIRDVSCSRCKTVLGWTYVKAYNEDNKYKEGKSILEKKLLTDDVR